MLLSYKVENFESFKDELEFNMILYRRFIDRFENNIIVDNNLKISRLCAIAGENGSDKTSFMRSIHFLKHCILYSNHIVSYKNLLHKYLTDNQHFEIEVLLGTKIYKYNLEINLIGLIKEKLSVKENKKNHKYEEVFESILKQCDNYEISVNSKYINEQLHQIINQGIEHLPGLMVNHLYKLNIHIVKPFIDWLENKLIIETPHIASLDFYESLHANELNLEIMKNESFLEIIQLIDSSIIDIEIDDKKPYQESYIIRDYNDGNKFKIKLKDESSGTREFFTWSVQIWKVIYDNATLFADEIDKTLNPILISKIISYIKGSYIYCETKEKYEKHRGQFIFSTHNLMALNAADYMKEQIYFITKKR
ncbi:MAG: AAA family ATPase [Peptostreptococcaceae bacterium]